MYINGIILLFSCIFCLNTTELYEITINNMMIQMILFFCIASVPCLITKRMSYVDIAWPYGLVLLGYQFVSVYENNTRHLLIGLCYLCSGLRMSLGATMMLMEGRLSKEFPRYEYQKLRWKKKNMSNVLLYMQIDLWAQCLANCTCLFIPGALVSINKTNKSTHIIEWIGFGFYIISFCLESVADFQKIAFIKQSKRKGSQKAVCNVGLWKFCRHPNYFFEWCVWNSILILTIPSAIQFYNSHTNAIYSTIIIASGYSTTYMMHFCLVYWTGCIPAEFYSFQKRPDYINYAKKTPMFIPFSKITIPKKYS